MPTKDQIPYDDTELREAYRRGWKAWVEGRLRPKRRSLGGGDWAAAWLKGYIAAEDAGTNQLCDA